MTKVFKAFCLGTLQNPNKKSQTQEMVFQHLYSCSRSTGCGKKTWIIQYIMSSWKKQGNNIFLEHDIERKKIPSIIIFLDLKNIGLLFLITFRLIL